MPKVVNQIIICSLLLCAAFSKVSAQGGLSFDLIKPKKFEEKKLASEKTDEKKFTAVRRFTQNGITKFNYNFNANLKLEMVLERAKAEYRDDYNKLLSFYNYDIKKMTPYHTELDSVIYKANMGILIHDLRNAWVDNLYMLMGKARYFKGDLDTAYLTFQYVNYAFSPKEKDGYDKPIGSNANEGGSAFSISTKEKTDLPSKVWSRPPSRNESFIWQIRTYLAKNENAEAAGLIETIKNDPLFPERLKTDLHEVQALWFYQQEIYDSAAVYLEKALPNAANNQEQARWEYLIGQLYERSDDPVLAKEFFEKAAKRTLNPVLEVYARLNATRQNRSDEKAIAENIEALLKMARKDRYVNYRDIIYFTAATMELDRKNIEGAKQLLLKATQAAKPNVESSQRTNAFLLLGDLSYETRKYHDAKRFYDSVNVSDPAIQNTELLQERKLALVPIVEQLDILDRNDSLQRIAAMPETEREAYVKKLVKQIRKARGIKDGAGAETESAGNNSINKTDAPADLFGNTKSDWYFDNASLKSKGFTEFRNKFGNRPNVDNWRRSSAIANQQNSNNKDPKSIDFGKEGAPAASDSASVISFESLMKNLPLTEEQMKISRDSMEKATFQLGKMYFESLEDYEGTIITLEELLGKYPATIHKAEALFILHYCYTKTGNIAKANETKQALEKGFPGSEYQKIVTNPKGGSQRSNELIAITKQYDQIYNDFIEGRFAKAIEDKQAADSMYGVTYWTPQLLYIESVYYIKQKDDPKARIVLQNIIKLYPNNEMAARAQTMLDVLGRRKEIEDYLTNLKIERPGEDSAIVINNQPLVKRVEVEVTDSAAIAELEKQAAAQKLEDKLKSKDTRAKITDKKDSIGTSGIKVVAKDLAGIQQNEANAKRAAEMLRADSLASAAAEKKYLDSVAAAQKRFNDSIAVAETDKKRADSLIAVYAAKKSADSLVAVAARKSADSAAAAAAKKRSSIKSAYSIEPDAKHLVILVLDKVDPVYVGEAKNAFNRYNTQSYYNDRIETSNQALSDSVNLVVMSSFKNAQSALDYTKKTSEIAGTRIIPWMPKGKFSFIVITQANLELLLTRKDLEEYLKFHGQAYTN